MTLDKGKNMTEDVIIIGGGPAGMTAAIYAARAGYSATIIEKIATGGQMILTDTIENYPGFSEGISGFELQQRMEDQATRFGAKIVYDDVSSIKHSEGLWHISAGQNYTAKTVIIATGANHRAAGIEGESEFSGRGVSYCATCDGPFFKGEDVAVIGGGDSALTEALFLSKICKSVTIIHRRDKFRAVASLTDKIALAGNIKVRMNSVIDTIAGDRSVEAVTVRNITNNKTDVLDVSGVFVFIGLAPNNQCIDPSLLDKDGYIITKDDMSTALPGLFAAGDIRSGAFRQVIRACGDGAMAAKSAVEYIEDNV
jgi:thioredoxin reductase (NADPH)